LGTDRLTEVLDATYDCLARYGVRRTTMDDIAGAVGMSRSAVYQYVRNKDDAMRRLAERLHDRAFERAVEAVAAQQPPGERVIGILAAKLGLVRDLSGDSPHAVELLDAKARLFGDICTEFSARVRQLLIEVFTEAGLTEVSPADAADIGLALVIGLESHPDAERLLRPAAAALLAGLPFPCQPGSSRR
jgi:AcrR family transcriptional regulator